MNSVILEGENKTLLYSLNPLKVKSEVMRIPNVVVTPEVPAQLQLIRDLWGFLMAAQMGLSWKKV